MYEYTGCLQHDLHIINPDTDITQVTYSIMVLILMVVNGSTPWKFGARLINQISIF